MINILIITQYFTPDITAAAFRMRDFYDAVKKDNKYEADVVTAYPHKSNAAEVSEAEGNIFKVDINKYFSNRIVRYLYQYFYFSFKVYKIARRLKKKYDIVFVSSPPIFTLIPAYLISLKYHSKLIIDIRDIWPDSAADTGMISERSIFYKITKRLEIFMYKRADIITCVAKNMFNYISQYTESDKIKVLYNGVSDKDIESVRNVVTDEKIIKGKDDKLKIFYAGNMGLAQKLDALILAFSTDESLKDKYKIHIIGDGALREEILLTAKNKCIDICYYGNLSKDVTLKTLYQYADILFISTDKKKSFYNTIPSKLFDYLLINKPIIYGIEGEGKEILDILGCGTYFDAGNEDSLIEVLNKIYINYDNYLKKSEKNREYVIHNFNRSEIFQKFIRDL